MAAILPNRATASLARALLSLALLLSTATAAVAAVPGREGVPAFAHVVVIVAENKDFDQVISGPDAPNLSRLARTFGVATNFYGETHPSEPNYVALLGGDTFGIHDDDAWYCKPGLKDPACAGSAAAGYPNHTVTSPHLGNELDAAGRSWRGYFEDIPEAGSMAYIAAPAGAAPLGRYNALYAAKHTGFTNFASTGRDPHRAEHLVGFDRLRADIASNQLPAFALIVPNQCNEMHGLVGEGAPADCSPGNMPALIRRGDDHIGRIVASLQASPAWRSKENMAIVVTFDEGGHGTSEGCCAATPAEGRFLGGGHIPTLVIANHGPRGLTDATAYNHYSLLRTIEDALGVSGHLGHAADTAKGVRPMGRLFGGS